MSHTPLTPNAENIRNEIKALLPEAQILEDDGEGNKMFGGKPLSDKLSSLKSALGVLSWGWTLWEFSGPTRIINKAKQMYLIPLSQGSKITPGGDLVEGQSTFITDEPILGPNARIIIVTPKVQ